MGIVARRYAKALLDAAMGRGEAAAVAERMAALGSFVAEPAAAALLCHPRVEAERKLALLDRCHDPSGGSLRGLFGDFLKVVVRRRREAELPEICRLFHVLHLAAEGTVEGRVEAARPLDPADKEALASALAGALQRREVRLAEEARPELMAGVRVLVAGRLYDASALGRLEEMRRRLLGVPLSGLRKDG